MFKTCSRCRGEKPLHAFGKLGCAKDGLQYSCKACRSLIQKTRLALPGNREKKRASQQAWFAKNRVANQTISVRPKTKQTYSSKWHAQYRRRPEVQAARREERYLARYRITLEGYNKLLDEQDGVCAICRGACAPFKFFDVDHNHLTDEVRGLLCRNCNIGLGGFRDNLDLLAKALDYLSFPR